MAAQVVLLRHGRTALNADGLLRGRLNPSLDEIGHEEAEAAAKWLSSLRVTRIVSSSLTRARQTAAVVSEATGVPVEVDDRLADRDYRASAGADAAELLRVFGSLDAVPDIEPRDEVAGRALSALQEHARGVEGVVVLVSHDAVIGILLEELGVDPHRLAIPTGSLSRLSWRADRWNVDSVGVTPGG